MKILKISSFKSLNQNATHNKIVKLEHTHCRAISQSADAAASCTDRALSPMAATSTRMTATHHRQHTKFFNPMQELSIHGNNSSLATPQGDIDSHVKLLVQWFNAATCMIPLLHMNGKITYRSGRTQERHRWPWEEQSRKNLPEALDNCCRTTTNSGCRAAELSAVWERGNRPVLRPVSWS